jgi:hypothetical protein
MNPLDLADFVMVVSSVVEAKQAAVTIATSYGINLRA